MSIIRDTADLPLLEKAAVSIGNFDGVHSGHRVLIRELRDQARRLQAPSMVVTFDPHPVEILNPTVKLPRLNTIERRAELLARCGVDHVVVLQSTPELLNLGYIEFFEKYVVDRFNALALVEGRNFFFGKDRQGNQERLLELCREHEIQLSIVDLCKTGEQATSSSLIRQLIIEGDLESANQLLTESYQLIGTVVPGESRGQSIGFPTANLDKIPVLLPADGVYGGLARLDGEEIPCAINIGPNPTFGEGKRKVEVHLIDFARDLYGRDLRVDLMVRIRGVQKFANLEELVAQIRQDVEEIMAFLSGLAR